VSNFIRLIKLIGIIRNENVRVVFSFGSQGALLASFVKIIYPFKIKVIVRLGTVFSKLFYNPTGNKLLMTLWKNLTLNFTYRMMNRIVCLGTYMKDELVSKSRKLKSKIVVIKNYIDKASVENKAKEQIDIKDKYIISVGRLESEKNYPGIIEAYNLIKDRIEHKLIILGNGSLESKLRQLISEYNLEQRVVLLGFKKNPYKYLARAESLILFSNFEGLPNVVIESLICKTPVIISDYPGVEDIIHHNWNGLVVQRGDINKLAFSIEKLLSNADLRNNFRIKGYESAQEFTSTIDNYENLILDLMN